MSDTLPDWSFGKACNLVGRKRHHVMSMAVDNPERRAIAALADYIAAHEQPPVDRKLLCAREAIAGQTIMLDDQGYPLEIDVLNSCIRAIELWENGYGK